jgi:hypothetical protein
VQTKRAIGEAWWYAKNATTTMTHVKTSIGIEVAIGPTAQIRALAATRARVRHIQVPMEMSESDSDLTISIPTELGHYHAHSVTT